MSNLVVKLQLNSLKNVFVKDFQGKTETKRCICIPIDDNDLFISEKGSVYLDLLAWENNKLKDGKTHLVKQSISKKRREWMSDDELKSQPILGDVKPLENQSKDLPTTDMSVVNNYDDDLPF